MYWTAYKKENLIFQDFHFTINDLWVRKLVNNACLNNNDRRILSFRPQSTMERNYEIFGIKYIYIYIYIYIYLNKQELEMQQYNYVQSKTSMRKLNNLK